MLEERACSYQERSEGWSDFFSVQLLPLNVLQEEEGESGEKVRRVRRGRVRGEGEKG